MAGNVQAILEIVTDIQQKMKNDNFTLQKILDKQQKCCEEVLARLSTLELKMNNLNQGISTGPSSKKPVEYVPSLGPLGIKDTLDAKPWQTKNVDLDPHKFKQPRPDDTHRPVIG